MENMHRSLCRPESLNLHAGINLQIGRIIQRCILLRNSVDRRYPVSGVPDIFRILRRNCICLSVRYESSKYQDGNIAENGFHFEFEYITLTRQN
jgi:hypothetical protein